MTRSLAFKLIIAFVLVGVTGASLAVISARWATFREFDRLVLERSRSDFMNQVSAYYEANGSWAGVVEYLPRPAPGPPPRSQPGTEDQSPLAQPQSPPFSFALTDDNGVIVVPAGSYAIGDTAPPSTLDDGTEIEVGGHVVGTALTVGSPAVLTPREERFVASTNRAVLYSALGATALAVVMGVILARTLTHPLRELTAATRAMARGELEQRVAARSRDELGELATAFNRMSADLARANEMRRQMIADIAHDLRTPLTVMAGYLEALRDGVLEPTAERFETMHGEAQHLTRLVEDLRTLSLADAGELTLNRELVSPWALLQQLAATYGHVASQRRIELHVANGPESPRVHVDPDRMTQALGNLVINALQHTHPGGSISLSARSDGDQIHLVVLDTGEGIAPEALPRVFDRFYRADEARQVHEGESGLGLAIAKSVVQLHGGTIRVDSTVGQGTVFTITLPVGETRSQSGL